MHLMEYKCQVCGYPKLIKINDQYKCEACGSIKVEETDSEQENDFDDAIKYLRDTPPRFEEAESRFDLIIKKYPTWSAGYWGRLLAKNGIKYEYDKGRAVPSCYFESYEDIRTSDDFKKAIKYADLETKKQYEKEAERIADVAKIWREKASKINSDIFISFKGTDDETNEDTQDRKEMRELYWYLTNKGYKVFFSDVTLNQNGIFGENCEPYIFDAIHDCKVMLVYGSKPEYFTATWIQNEWRRYNRAIANGEKEEGSLIVAYEGFDARELPIALKKTQAIRADSKHFYSDVEEIIDKFIKPSNETAETNKSNAAESSATSSTVTTKEYVFCKYCGSKIVKNSKFCPICGKKNDQVETINLNNTGVNNRDLELKRLQEEEKLEEERLRLLKLKAEQEKTKQEYERIRTSQQAQNVYNSTMANNTKPEDPKKKELDKYYNGQNPWVIFVLCLLFGIFGVHHFVRGDKKRGFLFLFTLGGFYYGWFISIIIHLSKALEYNKLSRR
jgi:DNA-directed RNA polymerase subunit RPC12/RpoP